MSEHPTITHADLARYWRCSAANVSNLVKRKGMPEFTSLRQADEWRAVNAPIRKFRQTPVNTPLVSSKNPVESPEKSRDLSSTTTPPCTSPKASAKSAQLELPASDEQGAGSGKRDTPPPPERIDVSRFVDHSVDFVELQIRNAKELAQITFGLLKLKTELGEPGAIAAASKNWHETSRAAADVIERFLSIQREAGTLIPLDDVEDVIATELEELRKRLKRLGKRAGAAANPGDPALAETAINAEVDRLIAAINNVVERAKLELTAAKDDAAAAADVPVAAPAAVAS